MPNAKHSTLKLFKKDGLIPAVELTAHGITGGTLQALLKSGELIRVSRGVYARADRAASAHETLACVALQSRQVVFCLLTALQWHGLTTQAPHQVWIAIAPRQRPPKSNAVQLRVVHAANLEQGVQTHHIKEAGKVPIRVTDPARTVADCFKFRNQVGLDIALEALKDAWQQKKVTMDELWQAAMWCRMQNVMRPYLESLT